MKIGRGFSRIILSLVLVGLSVQHSAPLFAQKNDEVSQLEKVKRQFNKIAKCALTKDGCTDQEALQLRVLLGTIGGLILVITGIGLGVYFGRRGKQPVSTIQVPGEAPALYRGYAPRAYAQYESYRESLKRQAQEAAAKAKSWWKK